VHAMLEYVYCGKTTKTAALKDWESAIGLFQTAQLYDNTYQYTSVHRGISLVFV
jgi:hypothetical protein